MKIRVPDSVKINPDNGENTEFIFEQEDNRCAVYVRSRDDMESISFVWFISPEERRSEAVRVLGDAWERSYGELAWEGIEPERVMPWYFAVSSGSDSNPDTVGRFTECFGVMVQPDAMCSWKYDGFAVTLTMDVRNGCLPVNFDNRTVHLATVLFSEYRDISAFDSLCAFCREMSPSPLVTDSVIYGSNNWYYAYGKSSAEEILSDTKLIVSLCEGNENKPYMVIDDGWTPVGTNPPWVPNERFGDMKVLSSKMAEMGVIPGIWVRYLSDEKFLLDLPDEARRGRNNFYLDPTHPAVIRHIEETTRKLCADGYKLIKHDYSTFDICGRWGREMSDKVCCGGEGFFDRSKTTAQVIKDFYKLILANAGDTLILGCNTVSHLCAGLCHANRTGDDTSGRAWGPTRKNGINTLAFRACQNRAFYIVDADCVGEMGNYDWNLNSQWLRMVAESGTSLFVSCKPSVADGRIYEDLKREYSPASRQNGSIVPLDWMETNQPREYLLDGEKVIFDWTER